MDVKDVIEFYKYSLEAGERRTSFDELEMSGKKFCDCELRCVGWGRSDFSGAVFVDCDLRGSDFSKAKMYGAKLVRCRIYDCNFSPDPGIQFVDCEARLFSENLLK